VASEVIAAVRKAKSESKVSMRTEVAGLRVRAAPEALARLTVAERDLRAAARARAIDHVPADTSDLQVTVTL
jgi:valyl-tRNA synthetase